MSALLDKQHAAPSGQQYLKINVNVHARHPQTLTRAVSLLCAFTNGKTSILFL